MSRILIKNICQLIQVRQNAPERVAGTAMSELPMLEDAWLAIDNGIIGDYGSMSDFPGISDWNELEVIDAEQGLVMPTFVDSHTHLVYAGSREGEFVDRIK